jgi:hypothetical protein
MHIIVTIWSGECLLSSVNCLYSENLFGGHNG